MPTIKDIANELNVSVGTVSKGLNGGADISDDLRKKILDTAVRMGYEKKKTQNSPSLKFAVFIENIAYIYPEDFGYNIILGFKQASYYQNWQIDIITLTPDFQNLHDYDTLMLERGYTGAFILGLSLADTWMNDFAKTNFPTVLLDNFVPGNPSVGYIATDSFEGIDMAVKHLAKLGHEKIAFLDGSSGSFVSDQRMLAYLNAMRRAGLPINPSLAVYGYFVKEAAKYHVPGFIDAGATAIICGNDLIAEGVLDCIKDQGLRIPDDISVVGFDDLLTSEKLDPPLTTVKQDTIMIGKSAYYILHAMMNKIALSKNLLRPSLIVRKSTAIAKPRLSKPHAEDPDSVDKANPKLYDEFIKSAMN